MSLIDRLRARWAAAFDGETSPWGYASFRVAVAAIVLVRTGDWLEPFVELDHHQWVEGVEHAPWVDPPAVPRLDSPLLFSLSDEVSAVLAVGRIVLAALLLVGVRPRAMAGLLFVFGYLLMGADRYRYLHHMHLLWTTCGWLALAPCGQRLSVERWLRCGRGSPEVAKWVPVWPLRLLRLHLLVVYAASGIAKLSGPWLDGRILTRLAAEGLVEPWAFQAIEGTIGAATAASAACLIELALVPLLAFRRTRVAGVALGFALHLAFSSALMVSTFGATMAALLLLFLPWPERPSS